MQLCMHNYPNSYKVNSKTDKTRPPLYFRVFYYKTGENKASLEESNQTSLRELLLRKKVALQSAFEEFDVGNTGVVTRTQWSEALSTATNLKIRWLSMAGTITPDTSWLDGNKVHYLEFLKNFSLGSNNNTIDVKNFEEFYQQKAKLEKIFIYFDSDGDGEITREEFHAGCEKLNANLHEDCKLKDVDHMLDLMDFDGSGTIDINEFLETFRILDGKDGQVDGVIGIATPK